MGGAQRSLCRLNLRGRIGYVHVRGMNTPSFNAVYDRLLGKYRNCDAVVVDTRWNGGGWLHNDLAVLLSGKGICPFHPKRTLYRIRAPSRSGTSHR